MAQDTHVERFVEAADQSSAGSPDRVVDENQAAGLITRLRDQTGPNSNEIAASELASGPIEPAQEVEKGHTDQPLEFPQAVRIGEAIMTREGAPSYAEAATPQASLDKEATLGSKAGGMIAVEDPIPDTATGDKGGDGILPPRDVAEGHEAGDDDMPGTFHIEGKVWPYGGEREPTAESDVERLYSAAAGLLKNGKPDGESGCREVTGFTDDNNKGYLIASGSKAVEDHQRKAEADGGKWDGEYNSIFIKVKDFETKDERKYWLFKPGKLTGEEDFRELITRMGARGYLHLPKGWSVDPSTWPIDGPVAIRSKRVQGNLVIDLLDEPYEDPLLNQIGQQLEVRAAKRTAWRHYAGAYDRFDDHAEHVERRHGYNDSDYWYNQYMPKQPADNEGVRQALAEQYRYDQHVLLIKNPSDADPITAIEQAQKQACAELQATIGVEDPRLPLTAIKDFMKQLDLSSSAGLVVFNTPDEAPDSYSTPAQQYAHVFANEGGGHTGTLGVYNNRLNVALVAANKHDTTAGLAMTAVHEYVGHSTEQQYLGFTPTEDGIYVWNRSPRYKAIMESRGEFLAANFVDIHLGHGGSKLLRTVDEIAYMPSVDKYQRGESSVPTVTAVGATIWELLIWYDGSIFEPFVSADTISLREKVEAVIPGLFERMEQVKDIFEFAEEQDQIFASVLNLCGIDAHDRSNIGKSIIDDAVLGAHRNVTQRFREKLALPKKGD